MEIPALKVPSKNPSENLDDWEDVEKLLRDDAKELPYGLLLTRFFGTSSHAVVQSYASETSADSGDPEKMLLYKRQQSVWGVNHKHFEGRLRS